MSIYSLMPILEYFVEVLGPDLLVSCYILDKLWDNGLQNIQDVFLRPLVELEESVSGTLVHN